MIVVKEPWHRASFNKGDSKPFLLCLCVQICTCTDELQQCGQAYRLPKMHLERNQYPHHQAVIAELLVLLTLLASCVGPLKCAFFLFKSPYLHLNQFFLIVTHTLPFLAIIQSYLRFPQLAQWFETRTSAWLGSGWGPRLNVTPHSLRFLSPSAVPSIC